MPLSQRKKKTFSWQNSQNSIKNISVMKARSAKRGKSSFVIFRVELAESYIIIGIFLQSISTNWVWRTTRIPMVPYHRASIGSWKAGKLVWWWRISSQHLSNAGCTSGTCRRCQKMHSTAANGPCCTAPPRTCWPLWEWTGKRAC